MSTPSRSKDLYAAVDSRRASPLMNASTASCVGSTAWPPPRAWWETTTSPR